MERKQTGMVYQAALLIGAVSILATIVGLPFVDQEHTADIRLVPQTARVIVGESFTVDLMVVSRVPVNVFTGRLHFDDEHLVVEEISYNTSIASLWAEKPWYEDGAGTVHFAGGSTAPGGFIGEGTLISVTFRTLVPGISPLRLSDARILAHDGFGSDVALQTPVDAVFTIDAEQLIKETIAAPAPRTSILAVSQTPPSTDLDGDGKHTALDLRIFMLHLFSTDMRFDFNQDGRITIADLSILMQVE